MRNVERRQRGFTLVELLTVIAIIGILAGLSGFAFSKAMLSARVAAAEARMRSVALLLYDYYAKNGTFPPAYGYIEADLRDQNVDCLRDNDPTNDATPREDPTCLNMIVTTGIPLITGQVPSAHFVLDSYLTYLGEPGNLDLYDNWSGSYDTDGDGVISYMEYLPPGDRSEGLGDLLYEDGTRGGTLINMAADTNALLNADSRPFLYFPVNKRQAERMGREYFNRADVIGNNDGNLTNDDPRPDDDGAMGPNTVLQDNLTNFLGNQNESEFPPPMYDAFVLVSVGPGESTYGLLRDWAFDEPAVRLFYRGSIPASATLPPYSIDLTLYPAEYRYHILANVMYFMLTRDADGDLLLDFDYNTRGKGDQSMWELPEWGRRFAQGPRILVADK